MTISREQFIRGFNAIRQAFARRDIINDAGRAAGREDFDVGTDPVVYELQRQLEERCGDAKEDMTGTAISYGLHEGHIVSTGEGRESFRMNTAEAVWRWWEETETGPFRAGGAP
ncbi:MAG: hypothetical protein ACRED4_01445 [Brevundimonas sp.]